MLSRGESMSEGDTELDGRIKRALAEFFNRESEPSGYLTAGLTLTPSSIPLSRLSEVISAVPGEKRHTLLTPQGDIPIGEGEIITYAG
jgi:hypothetical protein